MRRHSIRCLKCNLFNLKGSEQMDGSSLQGNTNTRPSEPPECVTRAGGKGNGMLLVTRVTRVGCKGSSVVRRRPSVVRPSSSVIRPSSLLPLPLLQGLVVQFLIIRQRRTSHMNNEGKPLQMHQNMLFLRSRRVREIVVGADVEKNINMPRAH